MLVLLTSHGLHLEKSTRDCGSKVGQRYLAKSICHWTLTKLEQSVNSMIVTHAGDFELNST